MNSMVRSSHLGCSIKKGVLKNFAKLTGKHLCQSLFFNKVLIVFLLKKRLSHRCFPVNFVKFLKTPFLQNTTGRLLLKGDRWNCRCLFSTRHINFFKKINKKLWTFFLNLYILLATVTLVFMKLKNLKI